MTNRLLSASSIQGTSVCNAQGEDLGEIEDLMIDVRSDGRIEYAVLSFGGFLGLGEKYFAIPMSQLSADRDDEKIILNVDKDRLKNAPGFDKDNWPDFSSPKFKDDIHAYYA